MKCEVLQQIRSMNVRTIAKVIIKVIELGDYTIITSDDLTDVSAIYKQDYLLLTQIKADITASPDGSIIVFDKKDFLDCYWKLPGEYIELIVGFNKLLPMDNKIIHKLQQNDS